MSAHRGQVQDIESESLLPVEEATRYYKEAVDEEFRLLGAGEIEEALSVDEERVDPRFEVLREELEEAGDVYNTRAQQTNLFANVGSAFTLLLAACIIGLLFRWVGRTRLRLSCKRQSKECCARAKSSCVTRRATTY